MTQQGWDPSSTASPEALLKQLKMQPPRMSDAELAEAIRGLATSSQAYMSHEYYMQIIGAIRILAEALTAPQKLLHFSLAPRPEVVRIAPRDTGHLILFQHE